MNILKIINVIKKTIKIVKPKLSNHWAFFILLFGYLEIFHAKETDKFTEYLFIEVFGKLLNIILQFIDILFLNIIKNIFVEIIKDELFIKAIEAIPIFLLAYLLNYLKKKYKK